MNRRSKIILLATLVPGMYTASAFGNMYGGDGNTLYPVVVSLVLVLSAAVETLGLLPGALVAGVVLPSTPPSQEGVVKGVMTAWRIGFLTLRAVHLYAAGSLATVAVILEEPMAAR
jgi:hypothetical protein